MIINAAQRLVAAEDVSYLSEKFFHAVKYWVQPLGQSWEPRIKAYNNIIKAQIPSEYREGGVLYRGIVLTVPQYEALKGKYTADYPTSWTREEIPKKSLGIGWSKRSIGDRRQVKTLDAIPPTHRRHARVLVVFKKEVPDSKCVLDIDKLFLDPEYKAEFKSRNPKVKLTDVLFKSGWMAEVIVKPKLPVSQQDVLFESFFMKQSDDATLDKLYGK